MIGAIQNQDITIAAGASQVVQIAGQIVDFIASGSAFDVIEVRPDFMQGAATLKQGQGFDFGAQFTQLLVLNKGATALVGTLVISTSGFRNFRISGDVNVLDGGKSRTMQGTALVGYAYLPPLASNLAGIQLWNPATSAKNVFIEQLTTFSTGTLAQGVGVRGANAVLSTAAGNPQAKKINGTPSIMQMATQYFTTSVGVGSTPTIGIMDKSTKIFRPAEPIQLAPGAGLIVLGGMLNEDLGVGFEYFEEAA
jgi:hypothetical protein